MSVCFFVPPDQPGASSSAIEEVLVNDAAAEENAVADPLQNPLQGFWTKVMDDIKKVTVDDFKMQALPLARIKKIMKLDEEVKMISAEAPVLFAKAAEIFIHELTLRAWAHTEDNKRRTLQRNDIAMAISKSDQFDFLIDIVPRHEVKPSKPRDDPPPRPIPQTEQVCGQQAATSGVQAGAQPQLVIQPCAQLVQAPSAASSSGGGGGSAAPVAVVQQVVVPTGDVQQLPIQLTQAQLNMIRMQVQQNPHQPIVITAQHPSPQIIQVTSQAQQPQQQVFLAQVATSQDES